MADRSFPAGMRWFQCSENNPLPYDTQDCRLTHGNSLSLTLESELTLFGALCKKTQIADATDAKPFRKRPGGPLSEYGGAEIERRFEAGHQDSKIALEMDISLSGVAKRRVQWRRAKK
jgi:hypothetical protein